MLFQNVLLSLHYYYTVCESVSNIKLLNLERSRYILFHQLKPWVSFVTLSSSPSSSVVIILNIVIVVVINIPIVLIIAIIITAPIVFTTIIIVLRFSSSNNIRLLSSLIMP